MSQKPAAVMIALLLGILLATETLAAPKRDTKGMHQFINEMVREHKFKRARLKKLFKQAQYQDSIIEAMTRPAEAKPWYVYREIFLTPARLAGGNAFWEQNRETLLRAEQTYGVPAEIIIAILGVETRYGEQQGGYRVLDALTTLAFYYPKRATYFRKELKEFLLLTREEKLNPLEIKGSYAGAVGEPQFMPSSYRQYAVDFDNDGKRNLMESTADTIGSVANYFKKHKWQTGASVITRASVNDAQLKPLLDLGLKPATPVAKLMQQGVVPADPNLAPSTLGALIELEDQDGPEHWIGLDNFYVITRYNHSPLYAMAVYQLSQQILAQRTPDDPQANR